MGHRAQERADRPKEPEGSHPPPQHRLYPDAARSERYKEPAQRVSRRTLQPQPETMTEQGPALLAVNNIEVIYNHVILVLKGVSLSVPERGIVALLGANGAGKTTSLKAISNLLRAERGEVTKGSITFAGARIDRLDAADVVRSGLIQVMEGRHCFEHLTVEENLLTGAYTRRDGGAAIRHDLDLVYSYFPRLREDRK